MLDEDKKDSRKVFRLKNIRMASQGIFLLLVVYLTFLHFPSSRIFGAWISVCWLDPLWHIQALFASHGNLDIDIHLIEGQIATNPIQRIPLMSVLYLGIFIFLAMLSGRIFCGWLCPFGTILQCLEVISPLRGKLSTPHEIKDPTIKYSILVTFIILAFLTKQEIFCEFCPAGIIFKGLTGHVIQLSIIVFVPVMFITFTYGRKAWCSYLCPLGAFFAPFNRLNILGIRTDKDKCIACFMCNRVCPMDVLIVEKYVKRGKDINDLECIKCMKCVDVCPKGILWFP